MKRRLVMGSCLALAATLAGKLQAEEPASADARYGWFSGLDQRSGYGQGVFPEPFMVDDSDLETSEFRLDWLRTAAGSAHSDLHVRV